jgi:hypothetical protein
VRSQTDRDPTIGKSLNRVNVVTFTRSSEAQWFSDAIAEAAPRRALGFVKDVTNPRPLSTVPGTRTGPERARPNGRNTGRTGD